MKVRKVAIICIVVILLGFILQVHHSLADDDMDIEQFKAQIRGRIDIDKYPRLSQINGWSRDTNFMQYYCKNTKHVIYLHLNSDFSVNRVEFRLYTSPVPTIPDSVANDALRKLEYIEPVVTTIEVLPSTAMLNIGKEKQFKATAYDQAGEKMEELTFRWSSSDTIVGMIDANGLFTAKAEGETTIEARSGDKKGTASVKVSREEPILTSIKIAPSSKTLKIGEKEQFKATAYDQAGEKMEELTFRWSSSDTIVGTIDANGLFTAKAEGETTIEARSGDKKGTASVKVSREEPILTSIKIAPSSKTLKIGDKEQFKATAYDQYSKEMAGVTFRWSSSDLNVGTIDANGLFTAKAEGETTIEARSGDKKGTASVKVSREEPILTSIKIAPSSKTLKIGDKEQFKATAYDQYSKEMAGVTFRWSSSDLNVGTIDANGLFTAKAEGETTIEARSGDKKGTASVKVSREEPILTSIKIAPSSKTLKIGEKEQFKATAYDQAGEKMEELTFRWSSSDTIVGTIDANGLFTAKAEGETTIEARSGDKKGTASVKVSREEPILTSIKIAPSSITLKIGDKEQFTATAYDQYSKEMTGVTFRWSSSDLNVGTIDANGLFTAEAEGETTIEARSGDKKGTASVKVSREEPILISIKIAPSSITLKIGDKEQFTATAYDQYSKEMTGVTFRWSSSDLNVGTIDANGLFTAEAEGETTIEARSGDKKGTASVKVSREEPILTSIKIAPSSITLKIGDKEQFTATAYDQYSKEMTGVTFRWSSSDLNVGTIDANGLFTAEAEGETTIEARSGDKKGTASVKVSREEPILTSIKIAPSSITLKIGDKEQFKATAYDQYSKEMTGVTFRWSSSDLNVGTIDANGLFTAEAEGETTIEAANESIRGTASVTVKEEVTNLPPVPDFTNTPNSPKDEDPIEFNASSSYDPDGNITKYRWEFGDGNETGEVVTHTYSLVGSYTVKLTVTDDRGATNSTEKTLYVSHPRKEIQQIINGIVRFKEPVIKDKIPKIEFYDDEASGNVTVTCYDGRFGIEVSGYEHTNPKSSVSIYFQIPCDIFGRFLIEIFFLHHTDLKENIRLDCVSNESSVSQTEYIGSVGKFTQFKAYVLEFSNSEFEIRIPKSPRHFIFFSIIVCICVALLTISVNFMLKEEKLKKKKWKILAGVATVVIIMLVFMVITAWKYITL